MKIESASCDGAEITGENWDISNLGPYSYRNMPNRQKLNDQQHKSRKKHQISELAWSLCLPTDIYHRWYKLNFCPWHGCGEL